MSAPFSSVLVTGGAGYIGSHAVLALIDRGYRVCVLDDLSTGFEFAVAEKAKLYLGDVGDEALLEKIFAAERPVAIMHFAGSIIVPESVEQPLRYYENNTVKSRALMAAASRAGIAHFIFSSTAAVYGLPNTSPVAEDSVKEPINPYGWSKLMTEQMLADTARATGMNYCALRYFNVAGADPGLRSGQSTAGATHLIKVACETATGKRSSVIVFGSDYQTRDGTGIRDYIHVSDLAEAHVLALEYLMTHPSQSLVLNCGYGRGFSVMEVLDAVDRATGKEMRREVASRRAGDPPELVSDPRRIRETLSWQPRYADLDTIILHALQWEQKLETIHRADRPD